MGEEEQYALVVDGGSNTMKLGFSGDDAPRSSFRTLVGYTLRSSEYVGDEAHAKRGILQLKRPIEHGIVTSWAEMEKVWHHSFYNELRVAPEEHPVLLTEAPGNPKPNREKTTLIMFEQFAVPALYLKNTAALAMYASGKTMGVVLDVGHTACYTTVVHEGYVVPESVCKTEIGGRDLTQHMMQLLTKDEVKFTTTAEREIVRDIKEKLGYVALYFDEEMGKYKEGSLHDKTYELPDGRTIKVGNSHPRPRPRPRPHPHPHPYTHPRPHPRPHLHPHPHPLSLRPLGVG